MSGIFSKMRDSLWGLLNAPQTESVEQSDDDWYEEGERDEPVDREDWYTPKKERTDYETSRKDKRAERQAQNNKILEMYGKGESKADVIVCHPKDVGESAKVCDSIRRNKLCVVNLAGMERGMAQRIADFLGGACYAVDGSIHRVSKDIFIIVPEGVRIAGDIKEELEKDGYVFPKTTSIR